MLGGFLALQTSRVKFVFAEEDLEVVIGDAPTEDQPENAFVGGENKWTFDSFVNWELWWPDFPVLVYFKETQTKPEGQIHFFPILFNGTQVRGTRMRCPAGLTDSLGRSPRCTRPCWRSAGPRRTAAPAPSRPSRPSSPPRTRSEAGRCWRRLRAPRFLFHALSISHSPLLSYTCCSLVVVSSNLATFEITACWSAV